MNIQKLKNTLTGVITSDKSDKTVSVLVNNRVKHPLYGKIVTRSKKYQAHDAENKVKQGDTVLIEECRPISKSKHWQVVKVVKQARSV